MKSVLFIFVLFIQVEAMAQNSSSYSSLIKGARGAYETKDYTASAHLFSEAFKAANDKAPVNDRYDAACSWALSGVADSSFVQLFRIAEKGNYTNVNHISTDTDLSSLYNDERWKKVIDIVTANKVRMEANYDKALVALLDTVFQDDQKYRKELKAIEEKYGYDSEEMRNHWNIIHKKDSINLIKVSTILDERGWLSADIIGNQGNNTLFLVIQHSDLPTQEKYLPMMREAVKKGNAKANSLALLEDRVALRRGGKQIYGSQVTRDSETNEYYVLPLIDPVNVDTRRAEVGLGPLSDYISNWGMTWDAEEYIRKLPEYEAKQKK